MKKLLLFAAFVAVVATSAMAADYNPTLVQGRTWRYAVYGIMVGDRDTRNGTYDLKVQGDTVVGDLTYSKIYRFWDGSSVPEAEPYFCAREDASTHRMYRLCWDGSEYLLYDFKTLAESRNDNKKFIDCVYEEILFAPQDFPLANGQTVAGFTSNSGIYLVEGIGWYNDGTGGSETNLCGDLTGISEYNCCDCLPEDGFPYLYEVADADGSVLLQIESRRPTASVNSVVGTSADATEVYYRFDGVRMENRPTSSGVYIRVSGGNVAKIVL